MSLYGDTALKETLYSYIEIAHTEYESEMKFITDLAELLADYIREVME